MQHVIFTSLFAVVGAAYFKSYVADARSRSNSQRNTLNYERSVSGYRTDATPQPWKLNLRSPNGMQYFADITVGGQTLLGLYDTGSFDIITVNGLCQSCNLPPGLKLYTNKTSSSFQAGDASVTGHWFAGGYLWTQQDSDTVHVGDADSPLVVKNMSVLQVVHTDMRLWKGNRSHFSTYVGLGHTRHVPGKSKSQKQGKSLLELAGKRRFAICFQKGSSDIGQLSFDPIFDRSVISGFRSVDVVGKVHWALSMTEVSYQSKGQHESACGTGKKCFAIIDSGTSMIGVPPKHFPFIHELSNKVKSDCSNLDELPGLLLELGQHKFELPPSAYVIRSSWSDTYCYPAFMDFAMEANEGDVWILGVPFLRHFFAIFDRDGPRVHIAEQGTDCEPVVQAPTGVQQFMKQAQSGTTRLFSQLARGNITEATGPTWERPNMRLTL